MPTRLSFTTAYNPKANGKDERRHISIVMTIIRTRNSQVGNWPQLLPWVLWTDQSTHSSVTWYMPTELMFGHKLIMQVERKISSWMMVDWGEEMSREELITAWIRQLERRSGHVEQA